MTTENSRADALTGLYTTRHRSIGDWLWCELMDYCKERGTPPSGSDRLFEIVTRARAAWDSQPASHADALTDGQIRKIAEGWHMYKSTSVEDIEGAIRDALKAAASPASQPAAAPIDGQICQHCDCMRPLHDLDCPVAIAGSKSAPAPADERAAIGAWITNDGRAVTAAQKQRALADGGAAASSVRPYSIPCYLGAVPAMSAEMRDVLGGNFGALEQAEALCRATGNDSSAEGLKALSHALRALLEGANHV
ncbi:TPA: hypothetical protein ACU9T0_003916 [Burkholderia cenocepacia]